jgi:pimeloyl-ACP methyl ester carboxylesterase
MTPMAVNRFDLPFSQFAVEDLRSRLEQTRWCDDAPDETWEYGFDRQFLKDICAYWGHEFDWKAKVEWLSSFQHFRFDWEGGRTHFIHERGKGPAPMPLILTHGWPGSFVEMMRVIPLLTDPAAHGGDPADAFDVVVPSLPGYGFSDKPTSRGMNSFGIANLWARLMQALGYERFAAQGGDIGAGVTTVLGLRYAEHVIGIHLNYIPGSYRPYITDETELTQEEHSFLAEAVRWNDNNGAYAHLQGTRPQTAAVALNDSPAGLAAWMLEKFREWSDCDGDLYRSFTRDELLTNISLYWMTQTIDSSFRLYYENRRAPLHFEQNEFVQPPCAVARFPKEILSPPREWVERGYNVQRWTNMPHGGHFAAAEEPDLLVEDMRTFFRGLRK